ncbi:MAG: ABC transporter permease [Acidimicrobiia bacterium]
MSDGDIRTSAEAAALSSSGETGVEEIEGIDTGRFRPERKERLRSFVTRYGLLLAIPITLVLIWIVAVLLDVSKGKDLTVMRFPEAFFTWGNFQGMFNIAVLYIVLAVALTIPLSLGEFDLSIANGAQLWSALLVALIVRNSSLFGLNFKDIPWPITVLLVLLFATAVGIGIGALIVWSKVNAFIVTLGAGLIYFGFELRIVDNRPLGALAAEQLPQLFKDIGNKFFPGDFFGTVSKPLIGKVGDNWNLGIFGSGPQLGVQISFLIAIVFAIVLWFIMERTVMGRQIRAVGGNAEAARLSGVRVDALRIFGFAITAGAAGLAGWLTAAQSQQYTPNAVTALLLPAYAACFLGATAFRPNLFQISGTLVGVAFLVALTNGLLIAGLEQAFIQVISGAVLILAVVLAKLASRGSAG